MAEPFDSLIAPIRQYLTKIEWLDWSENVVGDYTADVTDGSLSIDKSNDIRRTFSMVMNNTSGLYIPWGSRTNLGVKVRIKRGIHTPSGNYWWNRGVFGLTDPEAINKGAEKTVTLQGSDKWAFLDGSLGGKLTHTTTIDIDTNVGEAIMAVAEDGGETKFAFAVCDVVTPYTVTREAGETRADLIKELALICSWDIYYDVDGYLRFCPLVDPLQKNVVADLSVGGAYRNCYVSSSYKPKWSEIKNYWRVIGYSDSDTGEIFDGFAQNNNPLSPTNTATPPDGIGQKPEVITDTNLTTDDLCTQRAGYELRKNLTQLDVSSHEIFPLPFLNEGDCVQLEDDDAGIADDKYQIQTITESLLSIGLTELECWKCTSVYEVVAEDTFQLGVGLWHQLNIGSVDIYGIGGDNCLRKTSNADPNGGYRVLDKACTDFEFTVYTRRDLAGSGANRYSIVDSSGNGYGISLDYAGNLLAIQKRVGWTASTLASSAVTPALTSWYTLRFIKIASNFTLEIHDGKTADYSAPLASVFTADDSYTSFDREAVNGGYVFYSDNPTVCKLL